MSTRSVLVFVILLAWSIHHSESAFNRSSCRDASVPSSIGLIVGGRNVPRNKWPWLVAMFTKNDYKTDDKFFCGGSLISERFVLTAAHCIQNKGEEEPRKPIDVNVYLGKRNLTDTTEPNAVLATPETFIVHRDWNVSDTRWDADIAIVKLSEDVKFSRSVQPVCLWTAQMQPNKAYDAGILVGWGQTENQSPDEHPDTPRELKLPVLPIIDCFVIEGIRDAISDRGLCVGGKGIGPCFGDAGSGLFTFRSGKWFLRGITSFARLNEHMECDMNAPSVSTNVEKFTSFIDQILYGGQLQL